MRAGDGGRPHTGGRHVPVLRPRWRHLAVVGLLLVAACRGGAADGPAPDPDPSEAAPPGADQPEDGAEEPDDADDEVSDEPGPDADGADDEVLRPAWLGTRPLPERPDGLGEVQPTPPELVDRRLPPPTGGLPDPPTDTWQATIDAVPADVAARSTWHDGCPVTLADLAYVTFTFWGFDDRPHTGELLIHRDAAEDVVDVLGRLYEARFPLEEVRIIAAEELDLPPTGDGNVTTGFVCRSTVQGSRWSDHAYGRAIDVNPFHNPYARGEVVVPELASAYLNRGDHRPGMVQPDDVVVAAFASIGWGWGGDWQSAKDWMHFSESGR